MEVNAFLLLSLAFASQFMLALADNDTECSYEGQRFRLDRSGQLPLKTHYNCYTEIECKEICDAKSTCIIWQWQPTRRICWIMDVVPYPDRNSDFGINNCDKGKPTENAPLCVVTKGDRNNVWQDYRGMTKDDCELECILDSDCLIWQHIRSKKLCRIHKLEIDVSKKSQVGVHYCSNSKPLPTTPTTPTTNTTNSNTCYLNRLEFGCCPQKLAAKNLYVCDTTDNKQCKDADAVAKFANKQTDTAQHIMIIGIEGGPGAITFLEKEEKKECVGEGKMNVYKCTYGKKYTCTAELGKAKQFCQFRVVKDGLKAIHCHSKAAWNEVYKNKNLYDCPSENFLAKHLTVIGNCDKEDCDGRIQAAIHAGNQENLVQKVIIITSAYQLNWRPYTLELPNGNDVCETTGTKIHVYKCYKLETNKYNCVNFDNFPEGEDERCLIRVEGENLETIRCGNPPTQDIYPIPRVDSSCKPFDLFMRNHICGDCKFSKESAIIHSNQRNPNGGILPDKNTVISPITFGSMRWYLGEEGKSCVGIFEAYVIFCNTYTDEKQERKYRCCDHPDLIGINEYLDCIIDSKLDYAAHLNSVKCIVNGVQKTLKPMAEVHKNYECPIPIPKTS